MKASYNCGWASAEAQVVCDALKRYGMFVADNGSDWYISGSPDSRWSDDNVGDLKDITGDAFEVVDTGEHLITDQPYGDNDGDGYINSREDHVGTGESDPCGGTGWPSDLVSGGFAPNTFNVQDLASFVTPVRQMGKSPGDPGFSARWDLVPGTSIGGAHINVMDISATVTGVTGYPPMLDGQRAFGQTCPFPP
jgi:hypothetical protein